MKIKKGFVVREVGGRKYAVATGDASHSFKGMLGLNDVGAHIFNLMQNHTTADEIVASLLSEYDVEESVVRADVAHFIDQLRQINVLDE